MQFLEVSDIVGAVDVLILVKASHDQSFYHTLEVFHILLSVTSETEEQSLI